MIEPLEIMHQAKLIAIYNNQLLDVEKTCLDMSIKDMDKILLNGIQGKFAVGREVKFFKRFRDVRASDSWYVGRDRWDALTFIPNKNIRVYGIGIFEVHPEGGPFTIGYRYIIDDSFGNELFQSEVFEEEVTPIQSEVDDHIIKYKLQTVQNGIEVKANYKFTFCMWMTGQRCYYSESGESYREVENPDMELFEIQDSRHCTNSTRVNRGVMPGILYSF